MLSLITIMSPTFNKICTAANPSPLSSGHTSATHFCSDLADNSFKILHLFEKACLHSLKLNNSFMTITLKHLSWHPKDYYDSSYLSVLLLQALNRFLIYLLCLDNIFEAFLLITDKKRKRKWESGEQGDSIMEMSRVGKNTGQSWADGQAFLYRKAQYEWRLIQALEMGFHTAIQSFTFGDGNFTLRGVFWITAYTKIKWTGSEWIM